MQDIMRDEQLGPILRCIDTPTASAANLANLQKQLNLMQRPGDKRAQSDNLADTTTRTVIETFVFVMRPSVASSNGSSRCLEK